jgi:hypothetical protein
MRGFGFAILGFLVLTAAGLIGGFYGGAWLAEMDDPRCFEGSCGLAGVAIAQIAGFVGAVAGPFAGLGLMWWIDRRKAKRAGPTA